jgi:predicted permease
MRSGTDTLGAALRLLSRDAAASILIVALLALGVGTSAAMYAVMRPLLFGAVPYPDPERLVLVFQTDPANGVVNGGTSFPDLADYRARSRTLESLSAYSVSNASLRQHGGTPRRIAALDASHDLDETLGAKPLLGRALGPEDDRIGAAPVLLLGYAFWRDAFGADPGVIGMMIEVDGRASEIIGVMPAAGPWSLDQAIWRPVVPVQANFVAERSVHSLRVVARLASTVDTVAANAELAAIARDLQQEYPEDNRGRGARVISMHAHLVRDLERPLWLLALGIAALFGLALSSTASLLLARAGSRVGEFALRASLGASQGRLLTLLATETMLLAALGTAGGVALAYALLEVAATLNPLGQIDATHWRLDLRVLAFAAAASLCACAVAGVLPALAQARVAPARALGGARGSPLRGGERLRRAAVVSQVAIALVLLCSVGVLLRSQAALTRVDLGLRDQGLVSLTLALPPAKYPMPPLDTYPEWPAVVSFMDRLAQRLNEIPGIAAHGLAQNAPLRSAWTTTVAIVSAESSDEIDEEWQLQALGPGTRATLGVPLLAGRDIGAGDRADAPAVVQINAAAARAYFGGQDPVGKRIAFWEREREIVGVIGDMRSDGITEPTAPAVFPPLAQTPFSSFSLVVHAPERDPTSLLAELRQAVSDADPDVVSYAAASIEDTIAALLAAPRFALALAGLLAALATVIAVAGLAGLVALDIERRRGEIGLRVAIGARENQVTVHFIVRATRLAGGGIATGLATYVLAAPLLERFVYGISPLDPTGVTGAALLFALAAVVVATLVASRSARIAPAEVLRAN